MGVRGVRRKKQIYVEMKNRLWGLMLLLTAVTWVNGQDQLEIKLHSVTGERTFILNEQEGKFVALHFLLKTECPHCLRHTNEYMENAGNLPDVIQVFIKPDTEEEIEAWATNFPDEDVANFPIYRDPEANLAKELDIPDGYAFHNQVVHYPALVLIGPGGNEVFRYIGENNQDRYSFEDLAAKVKELSEE